MAARQGRKRAAAKSAKITQVYSVPHRPRIRYRPRCHRGAGFTVLAFGLAVIAVNLLTEFAETNLLPSGHSPLYLLGSDAGDVRYPAFGVALGEHRMTVTHTDGFPRTATPTDALLIGMGERYDVLVTAKSGAFPLTALAEGKNALAREILRTGRAATAPAANTRPRELAGRIVGYADLRPADTVRLPGKTPDRTIRLELTGDMMKYNWAINGRRYSPADLHPVRSGERVRLQFVNRTTMWHPMHLHGHTFALATTGLRKDTAIVLPRKSLNVDFDADNPGRWMVHCHNVYHQEIGMMTLLGYQA